jgi:hypothetical protein
MTQQGLRAAARSAANGTPPATARPAIESSVERPDALPDIEYTGDIHDAEKVPVHVAFARVMADVQSIGKVDRRDDSGGRYNFRGVDRVVNAVGPALRRHGVLVLPVRVYDVEYRESKTKSGNTMQDVTLKVQWLVMGPDGDRLPELLESAGQATDTQDKGTSKAISVAQRVLFLAGLHIPTQDPDIDKGHDRGERPMPKATDYRDEALEQGTSQGRLRQMWTEAKRHGLVDQLVENENGDEEKLGALLFRVSEERKPGGDA